MMKIIRKRDVIRGVLQRWDDAYGNMPNGWRLHDGATVNEKRARIAALDLDTCASTDVDAAIGNTSWTCNCCDVCGEDVAVLVRIGEEHDYEARRQDVCMRCLKNARMLIMAAMEEFDNCIPLRRATGDKEERT